MDIEELRVAVSTGEIDSVVVGFTDHYGRTMGKRFDAEFFLESCAEGGTHACDYLLTVDMEMEPVEGFAYANWERGYGDFHLVPDLGTLRPAGWTSGTAFVLCDVIDDRAHEQVAVAPRSILRRQVDALTDAGFSAAAASELEFFLFRDSYRDAHAKGYRNLEAAGWYVEDYHLLQASRVEDYVGAARRAMRDSEIPVENSKGEAAVGQHELNIRFAEVLDMADAIVLSPGPGLPTDAGCLMEAVQRYVGRKPVFGVCLGMQALGLHAGGTLYHAGPPQHGVARLITETSAHSHLFAHIPLPMAVGLYHSWAVAGIDEAVTAKLPHGVPMAAEWPELGAYAVQFHPESILT
ncbi:MAG: hypothetical protein EBY44_09015, partial [Actinobacteria bacterium]|nr:hypothetical protein [Actinomycetota bacterium]